MAERKHRHIVETGLTMLLHANMPLRYWVDGFSTAVFLINRLPTPILNMDTRFQRLFFKQPDYNLLKVFGCRCFPYLRNYASNKLQPRSFPCVFLGYSPLHKGYRCLHPSTQRVYISRYVVFDEHFLLNTNLTALSTSAKREGELSVYPDSDEWIKAPHLQPSSPTDTQQSKLTSYNVFPNFRFITDIVPSCPTVTAPVEAKMELSTTVEITGSTSDEAPPTNQLDSTLIDPAPVVESEFSQAEDNAPSPLVSLTLPETPSSDILSGAQPPTHNNVSLFIHPMQTRTRAEKRLCY